MMAEAPTSRVLGVITVPSHHKQWSRASFKTQGKEGHFCFNSLKIEMEK
jgi:hypothetical protein